MHYSRMRTDRSSLSGGLCLDASLTENPGQSPSPWQRPPPQIQTPTPEQRTPVQIPPPASQNMRPGSQTGSDIIQRAPHPPWTE